MTVTLLRPKQSYHTHWFSITSSSSITLMANSILPYCFHKSLSILTQHPPVLSKTNINPPLKILNFVNKPIKTHLLRQNGKQGGSNEPFQRSNAFSEHNSPYLCTEEAFAPILELCASKKALSFGKQVHTQILKSNDLRESVFLDTKLVFMYGKCGSTVNAEKVFDKMSQRTVFTWNAIIGAYVSNGEPLKALDAFHKMWVSGVCVDAVTFPCVVKACGLVKNLNFGTVIHGLVLKCGYESVVFVSNGLVAMYAKCDDLDGARTLFNRMDEKNNDVVSWNSMISGYSTNGRFVEALSLFKQMRIHGVSANTYTFVAILQACEDCSFSDIGMEVHVAVLKSSFVFDVYVSNALIAMYVRCGKMDKAASVFSRLNEKDNVSWNSMITGFVQNGLYNDGMKFFCDMQDAGRKPDVVSVISIVTASGRLRNLLNGKEIHGYAIKNGFDLNLQVANTLIDMYAKCCEVDYMRRTYDIMHEKDVLSWATIIAGYNQNSCYIEAMEMFYEANMNMNTMEFDVMIMGSVFLACSGLKWVRGVKEIHGYVMKRGLSDVMLTSAIISTYGQCGIVDYARRVFDMVECKDVVSWTSLMSSYVHNGLVNDAFDVFRSMMMMMKRETGVRPDFVSLVCVLTASASLSALKKGKEIHAFVIRNGFAALDGSLSNALVDMYARCGALENANTLFSSAIERGTKDLVQWTSMINAYGMHGRGKEAVELFDKMRDEEKLRPDHVTFLALLYACSHSGLIDEGKRVLEIMEFDYKMEPWSEHYACLVDLLSRSNRLDEAYQFVKTMRIEPTPEVWCSILAACRVHANNEIGDIALKKLLELNPDSPGNFVLVSNVLASSKRWIDVSEVRTRMKETGLRKNPGCSWVEVDNKIHTFTSRDKSHPECDEIYRKLSDITAKLVKVGGYVAETKFVLLNVDDENEKVDMLYGHSERLAIAYALLKTRDGTVIRVTKNLRVCGDCHVFCKLVSKVFGRELVVRDANRFHRFDGGVCSCDDFW